MDGFTDKVYYEELAHMIMEAFFFSPPNQSILKEINPEYPLKRLTLKLKLQYFGHLMQRIDSLDRTMMLGKIEGRMRSG